MIAFDYVGLGALITSTGTIVIGIIVALRQTTTHEQLDSVKSAVTTSNGHTLGELADKNEQRNVAQDEASEVAP